MIPVRQAGICVLLAAAVLAGPGARAEGESAADRAIPGIVSSAEIRQELLEKQARVQAFLRQQNLGGVLLARVNNYSWLTAGLGDSHIVITSEVGVVSLLILRDGRRFAIASHAEMPRVMAEDLAGLGYEPREFFWYEEHARSNRRLEIIQELTQGLEIGSDVPLPGARSIDAAFAPLRYALTESEIKKYRWLGRNTIEALKTVCQNLQVGMTERQIEAMASDELMRRGIRPTVLLIGADERLDRFFHHTPSDHKLKKFIFVNVCARRWGLVVSVGRYVHFSPLPEHVKREMRASAEICARLQAGSKPGVKASELFAQAERWYAEHGFPDEWKPIHMGGAIGYAEREWVGHPASTEIIQDNQAFAWNPFVRGKLSFDTILVRGNRIENLTATPDWPSLTILVNGVPWVMPDMLVR
jgi:antitoxin VapB